MVNSETPLEVAERIGRDALRIYSDLTAQGDSRISTVKNTTTYLAGKIAQLAFDMHELANVVRMEASPAVEATPPSMKPTPEQLRGQSMRMRDEAAERFSDRLVYSSLYDGYVTRNGGHAVVFTPNGWRLKTDVYGTPDYDIYVR